jgi:hypothetical protein
MKPSWKIERRTFLRAGAICIGLPLLEQMLSVKQARAAGPLRFVVMHAPNGIYMQKFTPTTTGTGYALSPILTPLEALKDEVTVVSGLQNLAAGLEKNRHLVGIGSLLTTLRGRGADTNSVNNNISADQVIAAAAAGQTPFASLEFGGGEGSTEREELPAIFGQTLAWKDPTTPLIKETNPQAAFDRLFAGGFPASAAPDPGDTQAADSLRQSRRSVLDLVRADADALKAKLGPSDNQKLDEYYTSLRELEQRLGAMSGGGGAACAPGARPSSSFAGSYAARIDAFVEVLALALQCDMTRVATFMLADWESDYGFPELGLNADHHGVSHHGGGSGNLQALEVIDRWEVSRFANLASKLLAATEAGSSVLGQTALIFASEVSDGDLHSFEDLPVLVAGRLGGALRPGRHERFAGAPLANLWLTCMQGFGVQAAQFGSSTGSLPLG